MFIQKFPRGLEPDFGLICAPLSLRACTRNPLCHRAFVRPGSKPFCPRNSEPVPRSGALMTLKRRRQDVGVVRSCRGALESIGEQGDLGEQVLRGCRQVERVAVDGDA